MGTPRTQAGLRLTRLCGFESLCSRCEEYGLTRLPSECSTHEGVQAPPPLSANASGNETETEADDPGHLVAPSES